MALLSGRDGAAIPRQLIRRDAGGFAILLGTTAASPGTSTCALPVFGTAEIDRRASEAFLSLDPVFMIVAMSTIAFRLGLCAS
jgi:hypothetical protein